MHGCLPPTPTVVIFSPFSHSVNVLGPICAHLMVLGQMHRDTANLCVSKKDAGIIHRSQDRNRKNWKQLLIGHYMFFNYFFMFDCNLRFLFKKKKAFSLFWWSTWVFQITRKENRHICVCVYVKEKKNKNILLTKKVFKCINALSVTGSPTSFLLLLTQCAHGWLVDCDSQLIIAHRDMQPLSSWWSDNCSNVVWYEIRGLGDDVATCGLHPVSTEGPCCES